jgi:hypothetical protein
MAHPARFELTPVPPRVARQMNFSISPRRRKRDARSVRQGWLPTRSIIFPPCALQPHTGLDRGRRRHPLTYRRSGLSPRCRSASSPSSLRWWGPSRSTRRSFLHRLRTDRARQPHLRLRRCCADLRRVPPDWFRSAHPDTRSPRVTAVLGRVAATTPRAGRLTTIGRIMATAIPSAGSPASDLARVASIALPGSTVAAGSRVAASTVARLFRAQPGSAVSARRSDISEASAGDKRSITRGSSPSRRARAFFTGGEGSLAGGGRRPSYREMRMISRSRSSSKTSGSGALSMTLSNRAAKQSATP